MTAGKQALLGCAVLGIVLSTTVPSNAVPLTAGAASYNGTTYQQNFDGITGTTVPTGWFVAPNSGASFSTSVTSNVDIPPNAAPTTPGFYFLGAANGGTGNTAEKALGSLTGRIDTGGTAQFIGLEIQNNGPTKGLLDLKFSIESYNAVSTEGLGLFVFLSDTRLDSATAAATLGGGSQSIGTFLPGNQAVTYDLTSTLGNWKAGSYLYLSFRDQAINASNGLLAVDNLILAAVPEPATWIGAALLTGFAAASMLRRRQAGLAA